MSQMKLCLDCEHELPIEDFPNKKDGKFGKGPRCKKHTSELRKQQYKDNPEYAQKARDRAAKRNETHSEQIKEYHKEWYQKNKKEVLKKRTEKRLNDPEFKVRELDSNRKRYAKDPKKYRDRSNAWSAKNPGKLNGQSQRRRAVKLGARVPGETIPTVELLMVRDGSACSNVSCGVELDFNHYPSGSSKPSNHVHIEHLIPLIRGGKDILSNTQLWCQSCNTSKSYRTIGEYLAGVSKAEVLDLRNDCPIEWSYDPTLSYL